MYHTGLSVQTGYSDEVHEIIPASPYSDDSNIDWTPNLVKPKDQGVCGSCWTFCTVGAVEALYSKVHSQKGSTPVVINLSEQLLVDCDRTFLSHGCDGGEMNEAYDYMIKEGVVLGNDYPYKAANLECKAKSMKFVDWKPKG